MIPLLSISQNGYPKVLVINNDTIVAFTPAQARTFDYYRLDWEERGKKKTYFQNRLKESELLNSKFAFHVNKLEAENKSLKVLDTVSQLQIANLDDKLKKSQKSNNNKSDAVKVFATGFVVVSLTLIGVLVFK